MRWRPPRDEQVGKRCQHVFVAELARDDRRQALAAGLVDDAEDDAAQLPPVEGYAQLRAPAGKIDGVGINMVTEILCTFAPKRYAVFNGNTADALRVVGADPPKSVTLFSADAYARVCGVVESIRRRIGGEDLSDADAFLNWIYQKKVKPSGK